MKKPKPKPKPNHHPLLQLLTLTTLLTLTHQTTHAQCWQLDETKTHPNPIHYHAAINHYNSHEALHCHLTQYNTDPNTQTPAGATPLHYAAQSQNIQAAELLLAHDANPNIQDNTQQTPLHRAIQTDNTQLIHLLLAHNANPNTQDNTGQTPLHLTAMHVRSIGFTSPTANPDTIRLLLDYGANPTIQNHNQKTPIHLAIENNDTPTQNLLQLAAPNPNQPTNPPTNPNQIQYTIQTANNPNGPWQTLPNPQITNHTLHLPNTQPTQYIRLHPTNPQRQPNP